jgi:CRISPR-associated protein Csm2
MSVPMKECRRCGKRFSPVPNDREVCPTCEPNFQSRGGPTVAPPVGRLAPGPTAAGRPGAPHPGGGQRPGPAPQPPVIPPAGGGQRPPAPPQSGYGSGPPRLSNQLPAGYLARGYFDEKGNLWPELLLDVAWQVAEALGVGGKLATAQLRRYYNMVRRIDSQLDSADFGAIAPDIVSLVPLVAYAVGRDTAPETFKVFIERNVDLAKLDRRHFEKGFVKHFEAVVCFHKYQNRSN